MAAIDAFYASSRLGGLVPLLSESIASLVASTQIFANAPEGTKMILFTPKTKGISLRTDGSAATAAAGHTFPADEAQFLPLTQDQALKCYAIEVASAATCFVTYYGG